MKKFWLVARYEFLRHVRRRRFILALLSMPIFIGLMVGVGILSVVSQMKPAPIGYVDASDLFQVLQPLPKDFGQRFTKPVQIIRYADENAGRTALEAKTIQALFVLDPDYLSNGQVTMVALSQPGENAREDFGDTLRYNLILTQPNEIRNRLIDGDNLIIRSADGSRQTEENNILGFILPVISGVLFMIAINMTGGYLMQAMVEEKENRTMEIMVTSMRPSDLMAGKVIGNLAVGLMQLAIWLSMGYFAILFMQRYLPFAQNFKFDPISSMLMLVTFLPAFVMVCALMAMVGAVVTDTSEAQQVAGVFTLPIVIPYFFITAIIFNPNGILSVALSIFPLTAPISLPLRAAFATIPDWQIAMALSLLVLNAIGALWLAGRAFRLGMLRYGKRLSLRELFRPSVPNNQQ
jgi:ABC-2 type transport system permease protein